MKLYKEGPGKWAAKTRLDTVDDIDIEVLQYNCGRSITIVRVIFNNCPEGMIMSFDYDGTRVHAYDEHNTFMGSDRLDRGCVKIFGWSGKPAKLLLGDFKQIALEYEN